MLEAALLGWDGIVLCMGIFCKTLEIFILERRTMSLKIRLEILSGYPWKWIRSLKESGMKAQKGEVWGVLLFEVCRQNELCPDSRALGAWLPLPSFQRIRWPSTATGRGLQPRIAVGPRHLAAGVGGLPSEPCGWYFHPTGPGKQSIKSRGFFLRIKILWNLSCSLELGSFIPSFLCLPFGQEVSILWMPPMLVFWKPNMFKFHRLTAW